MHLRLLSLSFCLFKDDGIKKERRWKIESIIE